ncbi:zinc-containing alcohol dehydrogenase superfamily protein [Caballeronia sordidicola]|uniref:Zinc-containing alcohol dehydrogenase superfamily protein n=1 Tax=Caballeronia sordidicola TaxID=196367 RepID=A0A158HD60_CABSO|nr:zinc-binding alcohol dehydrogenase family protein [Caballeronia sordidicola]SAL42332.1 zinc-containing alcohol dehydrogenase superfamily protein [Caballeronia sordidicola]
MKAAVVKAPGTGPAYADFDKPVPIAGHRLIEVTASALSHVTRSKASGSHYSSVGKFPFVAGVDGTGRLEDGRRVYFFKPQDPFGSMAEYSIAPEANCVLLPDAIDDVTAAAIAIPGMSSWAALVERARFVKGETVLVNGATGSSGRLAVQVAKWLGARKIIATGRRTDALASLKSAGADVTISLAQDEGALNGAFESQFREGVDVVLDYLWGATARSLLIAAAKASPDDHPVRFIQIGSIGGAEIPLPSAVLRAAAITLLGSGIGSVPLPRLLNAMLGVFEAAAPAGLQIATHAVPLADLGAHWDNADSLRRTVFIP